MVYAPKQCSIFMYLIFAPRKMLSTDLDFCLVLLLYVFLLADLEQFLLILRLLLMVSTLIKLGIAYFRIPLLDSPRPLTL